MAAMDLQCRLEHGEGRWGREDATLLERFDAERKEWESQLRDMQKNIEELYNEVKARREGNTTGLDRSTQDCVHTNSDKNEPAPPNHHCNGYFHPPNHKSNGINSHPTHHSNGCSRPEDHYSHSRRDSAEVELEDILHSCLGQGLNASIQPHHVCDYEERPNPGAVNSALKDIARVSEDLCSYQNVIRKQSGDKRNDAQEVENEKNKQPDWGNHWGETASRGSNKADVGVKPSSWKTEAPPIPPRTTSWYPNSSNSPEPQLPVQEFFTNRKCHSPCVLTDRKCTSPSVLRKFEAMLQENEGKTLTDSGVYIVPVDSKCNTGSCRVGNTKSSAFVPVQKWLPEASTLAAEKDCRADCRSADSQKFPRSQFQPMDRETEGKSMPMDVRGPWRSPGFQEENVKVCEMGGRPKGVNSYRTVQSVENIEERKPMGSSRFHAVNEKTCRPMVPATHAQSPDFWNNCREEEPNLRAYDCSNSRVPQGQKWGPNGLEQHDDLIELLGMLGIEHQYQTAKTHPQAPCQQETSQESQRSSVSVKKSFSRPARPANRRPPSRWASQVPPAPVTRVTPFVEPAKKQTTSPYSCQIETIIM
ncbi:uncharacterized protein KIAA0408-like isoform X4 [Conger conger]|uniref:uncharacterized protein KIAA0408-like isoform X4 n=1 Tax=Conger conger TaxID=82655 RepID=UPI002A5A14B9|nr:uncharacterized protein KIAA0408-like isoform X4 [Conger conger]